VERADAIIADRRSATRPALLQWKTSTPWAMATIGLLVASFLGMARVTEFLYFQF